MDRNFCLRANCHYQKTIKIESSLYTILRILSMAIFEKVSISQIVAGSDYMKNVDDYHSRLFLFEL